MAKKYYTALALVLSVGCEGQLSLSDDAADTIATANKQSNNQPDVYVEGAVPRASLHRLNRLEYNNSVRDLLGTELRPADMFPPDAAVGGFDNASDALGITPSLMDMYVAAATEVVEDAFTERPAFADRLEENDSRWTYNINRDANRIGGIVRLRGGRTVASVNVPEAGTYNFIVRIQGYVNGGAATPSVRAQIAGQNFDFNAPLQMENRRFEVELSPGNHEIAVQATNFEEDAPANRGNDLMFDFAHVETTRRVEGPARRLLLSCDPTNDSACTSTIVQTFAQRAWRRPLTVDETSKLESLLVTLRQGGESQLDALKLALRAMLSSPKFLYRYRTVADTNSPELLDPYVLASRLSYFIWSTTPDDKLLDAAANGSLSTPEGVRQTVAWMVLDPKADALADGFAEQWLDLRHLEQAAPSPETYPSFNESVRQSMTQESKLFFLDYLQNNAPIASMLEPDFAYRDANLANHLGLPAPGNDGFERVGVGPGDRRGVLALSAWLTSRSEAVHSSPIRRGAWVADNMLCAPVPPPPPGLEIGELASEESGMTLRERLEQHRSEPACATCHASLDVLGMGFEVYDGVAREIDDPTLDSDGEIPNGPVFRGADDMAANVDREEFVTCVSQKMLAYAVGRPVGKDEVRQIPGLGNLEAVTLSDLISAIVLSPAFSQPVPLK